MSFDPKVVGPPPVESFFQRAGVELVLNRAETFVMLWASSIEGCMWFAIWAKATWKLDVTPVAIHHKDRRTWACSVLVSDVPQEARPPSGVPGMIGQALAVLLFARRAASPDVTSDAFGAQLR